MEQQQQQNESSEVDSSGKSGLFSEKLKRSIFSTFHSIIQMFSYPFWQASVLLVIEFVQSLFFIFYPPVF